MNLHWHSESCSCSSSSARALAPLLEHAKGERGAQSEKFYREKCATVSLEICLVSSAVAPVPWRQSRTRRRRHSATAQAAPTLVRRRSLVSIACRPADSPWLLVHDRCAHYGPSCRVQCLAGVVLARSPAQLLARSAARAAGRQRVEKNWLHLGGRKLHRSLACSPTITRPRAPQTQSAPMESIIKLARPRQPNRPGGRRRRPKNAGPPGKHWWPALCLATILSAAKSLQTVCEPCQRLQSSSGKLNGRPNLAKEFCALSLS